MWLLHHCCHRRAMRSWMEPESSFHLRPRPPYLLPRRRRRTADADESGVFFPQMGPIPFDVFISAAAAAEDVLPSPTAKTLHDAAKLLCCSEHFHLKIHHKWSHFAARASSVCVGFARGGEKVHKLPRHDKRVSANPHARARTMIVIEGRRHRSAAAGATRA